MRTQRDALLKVSQSDRRPLLMPLLSHSTRCADEPEVETGLLLTLLRRFATEAAREEARMFCEALTAEQVPFDRRAAA